MISCSYFILSIPCVLIMLSLTLCLPLHHRVNPRKATWPDGVPDRVLRSCAGQVAGVSVDIFVLSQLCSEVPSCLKKATTKEKQDLVPKQLPSSDIHHHEMF